MGEGPVVAYQGEPGAFAEEAVLAAFRQPQARAFASWREVFEAVRDARAAHGAVPIENALAGTIRENHDLLLEFEPAGVRIVGEVTVPVRLALMAPPGATLERIERVHSHPQALAQADAYLRTRPWQVISDYNTAGAAKRVAEAADPTAAAVASPRVADLYGLDVLAEGIEGGTGNRTRFALLGRADSTPSPDVFRNGIAGGPRKTTLVFAVRNVPGSLHRSLGAFAERGLNLSRLESRPWTDRGTTWEYVFWVDLDADAAEPAAADALRALATETDLLRVLGSYPRATD